MHSLLFVHSYSSSVIALTLSSLSSPVLPLLPWGLPQGDDVRSGEWHKRSLRVGHTHMIATRMCSQYNTIQYNTPCRMQIIQESERVEIRYSCGQMYRCQLHIRGSFLSATSNKDAAEKTCKTHHQPNSVCFANQIVFHQQPKWWHHLYVNQTVGGVF